MEAAPTTSKPSVPAGHQQHLADMKNRYRYMTHAENQLAPISFAKSWPWLLEQYGPSWILPFLPTWLVAQGRHLVHRLRFFLQRITFRFDRLKAYQQLFPGPLPAFAQPLDSDDEYDAAFAWWRIAGANAILLRCERDIASLHLRIPFDVERIEARLRNRFDRSISLADEAEAGRLFAVDFRLIQSALRPDAARDSRWREKYLPAPIGVFLEAPGFYEQTDLVPLAIQIDQLQLAGEGPIQDPPHHPFYIPVSNPVYYPDDGWKWRIAKTYFDTADVTFHVPYGHVFRTHMVVEPFAMATPRQLPEKHPVFILLRPHTRFTLATNQAAYSYFIDRSKLYGEIYSGTMEETREVAIQGYKEQTFRSMQFDTDLQRRGVADAPKQYPYRDDIELWLEPIHRFVKDYIEAFYATDGSVQADAELQNWVAELIDPERGAVRDMLAGDQLDTRTELIDLLTQVLFTAGPSHAAQHFASNHFYRYAARFAAGIYAPPPLANDQTDFARWLTMLPPIQAASDQFRSNTFTNFQYDRFGYYDRFPLGSVPEARGPIQRLQSDLAAVERTIETRRPSRLYAYDFVLPSNVPNSINI